jgi:RNA polymerase sigma factor (TIGR02999 family)
VISFDAISSKDADGMSMGNTGAPNDKVIDEVTRLLEEAGHGESLASAALLPLVYEELRKLAAHRMTGERSDHTLQATALVHEAYIRLVGHRNYPWANRAQFFVAAAESMRRILIEHARAKNGPRRGGGLQRWPLDVVELATTDDPEKILVLDEAVSRLEQQDADAARVVRLRFYAGLSIDEMAQALNVSPTTVKREWSYARAFLFRALKESR